MATLQNIDNAVWCMSTKGPGAIVQGLAALSQCMDLILRTPIGSDPMRQEFGSNIYKYSDAPLNVAIPNIKREILDAIGIWEQRVNIVAIQHTIKTPGNPVFFILYVPTDSDIIEQIKFDLQTGVTISSSANEIILSASFPVNPNDYHYVLSLEKNGASVFPLAPPTGFASINELFVWVQANWSYLGKWYLAPDKLICYMNADGVDSATLSVDVLPVVQFRCAFPDIAPGEAYKVDFTARGAAATPAMPQTFSSPGTALAWAQANWKNYANWYILYQQDDANAFFSDEFSDEFSVPSSGYFLVGVSYDPTFTGELNIETVQNP